MSLDAFRSHFSQTTNNGIFFDNASMGPVAPEVTAAMTACMELRQAMPMKYYRYAEELFPACRALLARLIGCEPDDLVFTENVAYGINCAARALPLCRGDNVILCDREYSSNVYPWLCLQRDRGIEARIVPHDGGGLTVDRLEQHADSRTRAVTVSSVEFSDGFATDLEAIGQWCRDHGTYLVVDCAQSLGVLPMDVQRFHIDVLAGLSSKWLLGPFSTGFLYVRRELAQNLEPAFAGADSVKTDIASFDREPPQCPGDRRAPRFAFADGTSRLCGHSPTGLAGQRPTDPRSAGSGYGSGPMRPAGQNTLHHRFLFSPRSSKDLSVPAGTRRCLLPARHVYPHGHPRIQHRAGSGAGSHPSPPPSPAIVC